MSTNISTNKKSKNGSAASPKAVGSAASAPAAAASSGASTSGPIVGGVPPKGLKGLRAAVTAMAQGWATVFPADLTLPSANGGYSVTAMVAQLNGWLALYAAVDSNRAAWRGSVAGLAAAEASIRKQLAQLKSTITAYFGNESQQLVQFGLTPKKPRAKLSSAKLAVRAERSLKTRAIRGTMGAKQKAAKKYTGPLVSQVVVPDAPAETSGDSTAPAAIASPAGSQGGTSGSGS